MHTHTCKIHIRVVIFRIRTIARMDTIPIGHYPEWTQSRMDTIPNGHNPEWTRFRMSTYLVTDVFYTQAW